jgi:hypothetical protein
MLRTGHAEGADQSFEGGARGSRHEVYLPWPGYNDDRPFMADSYVAERPWSDAYDIAARLHPAWDRCSRGARALHARNVHIMLGPQLDDPARFALAWAPVEATGIARGGTGMAQRIAEAYGIEWLNVFDPVVAGRLEAFVPFPLAV